ncbi:translation initiation factor eIF-2B subunit alpha [Phymastichus coffea]|uniref:translation initiation factor eIF-2B subunit alpha n=1 Tax=Phymastichus coffea TaxID=108790 RepID=UPI00273C6A63|nr:translation initiation factor eIF-2B subunit alpha [Phymastichus coffea]
METEEICQYFNQIIENEKDVSAGIAAIRTLLKVLEKSKSGTMQEFASVEYRKAVEAMKMTDHPVTAIASGSELFFRFITLKKIDAARSVDECKQIMMTRGKIFYDTLIKARDKIAKLASTFIADGSKILTHSRSRVVLQTMKQAVANKKIFEVYVTDSSPDNSGQEMCQNLRDLGISCTLILDSTVGYIMEQVDMVMIGAEGVAESGGIINKVGTYTMAICAKEMKKPVYALTESFKFSRIYPLNQVDLPDEFKYTSSTLKKDLKKEHPLVDYTPPHYITLLFTDLGILTPSAVSDELINIYL